MLEKLVPTSGAFTPEDQSRVVPWAVTVMVAGMAFPIALMLWAFLH